VRKEKEALSKAHQESEGALEARLGELAGQLSDLQAQGGGVREELGKSREEVGRLRGELERLEEEVVGLKREVAEGRRAAEASKGRVAELEASGVRDKERLEKYAGEVMGLERDFGACRERARGLDTELAGLREKIAISERERIKAVEEAGKLKERVGALSGLDGKEREVARAVKQMWSAAEAMEGALTCLECMGLVNRAVTLNPCGHTVCHECWDKRRTNCGRKECGECSSLVEGTIGMPAMDQLASKLGFQKQALRALGENK
jgi:chromosome segregation ATPase